MLTFQPVSIRWVLLISTLISLSACSTDEEEKPNQLVSEATEGQALKKWILNYLDEVATDISPGTGLSPAEKLRPSKIAPELIANEPVRSDSLSVDALSWVDEGADSTHFFTQLVYELPDSLVQQLDDTLNNAELVIDVSVSHASDSASTQLSFTNAANALQQAALGPSLDRSSTAPYLVTLPCTLSQQGLPMNQEVDAERFVIPLKLIH